MSKSLNHFDPILKILTVSKWGSKMHTVNKWSQDDSDFFFRSDFFFSKSARHWAGFWIIELLCRWPILASILFSVCTDINLSGNFQRILTYHCCKTIAQHLIFPFALEKWTKIQIGQSLQLPMSMTLFTFTSTQTEKCYEMNTPVFSERICIETRIFPTYIFIFKVLICLYLWYWCQHQTSLWVQQGNQCLAVLSEFRHFSVQW